MSIGPYFSILLPEIILIVGACLTLFLGVWRPLGGRTGTGVFSLGVVALAAALCPPATTVWSWTLTQATGLNPGGLAHYIRLITLAVGAAILLVNWYQAAAEERGEYTAMLLLSMAGVMLTAMTDDLLLLFFALELVSVPTYVLVALSREDIRAQEACSKYFFLGAMSAALLAYGLSFIYGASGTTSMVQIAPVGFGALGILLAVGGLCFKLAAAPFHGYVADVYEGAAAPLAGALGFLPKVAGLVAMVKLFSMVSWELTPVMQWTLWIIAAVTMTAGNVLALMQTHIKRMLAYSGVAHSGYILVAVLVGPPRAGGGPLADGLSAALFYVAVYGFMNLGAFALLAMLSGPDREAGEPDDLKGLSRRHPWIAAGLAVTMFSLMGMPPTAGFLGKFYIFSGALAAGDRPFGGPLLALAIIGVINSAIAAAYYLRVVGWCYCDDGSRLPQTSGRTALQIGGAVCTLLMIVWFVWPQALLNQAREATMRHTNSAAAMHVAPHQESAVGLKPGVSSEG
jgi:NADH-quinone oxidoreductase subunit N